MKNQFFRVLLAFIMPCMLYSCVSDEKITEDIYISNHISINVSVPYGEVRTRGYGDGGQINELKCYVYEDDNREEAQIIPVEITTIDGKKGGTLDFILCKGVSYTFVFLATGCPQDNTSSPVYYQSSGANLVRNYGAEYSTDTADCFYGVVKNITVDDGGKHNITLKRPFAQLNLGTKDIELYNTSSFAPFQQSVISVSGVHKSMNLIDGNIIGPITTASFPPNPVLSEEFPIKGYDYLAMKYLLVDEKTNVNVTLNSTNSYGYGTLENIPVKQNYQTNVYGNLLTSSTDFKVEIKPDFESTIDEYLYDLILEVTNSHLKEGELSIVVTSIDGVEKPIDLRKYLDSNNMVKLGWNQLGLSEATGLKFYSTINSTNPSKTVKCKIKSLIKCDINKLDITDVSNFFNACSDLLSVEAIKAWDTRNIIDMSGMFNGCSSLTELDLTSFDTRNVTDMSNMFYGCSKINMIDLSSFHTSNVRSMRGTFGCCESLNEINISTFDTSNVMDMGGMFYNCSGLRHLDLSNFDTGKVINMNGMFCLCSSLNPLDLSAFETRNVTDMGNMFVECTNLSDLNTSSFDTKNVTNMANMFVQCTGFQEIDLSAFETPKLISMGNMFAGCLYLKKVNLSNFDTRNVTDMSGMFDRCLYQVEIIWGPNGGFH